jgi:hypothetical protein
MKLPSLTFTILYLKQKLKEMLNTTNENVAREKTFKQTFKKPKQQSGIGNTFHASMFLVVD